MTDSNLDFVRSCTATGERVLYVDDDELMRHAFVRSVSFDGQGVDAASSGAEAIALCREHRYPVIVTDLLLPDASAWTLISELHQLQPEASFVVVTGLPSALVDHHASDDFVSFFVKKPWDDEELAATLGSAYRLHTKRASMQAPSTTQELNVLLVEDNSADAAVVELLLQNAGSQRYRVTHVDRLEDALTLLRTQSFAVVITDLSLPDARGLDAVSQLRVAAPHAALLVQSGIDDEALSFQAVELGAQDYLLKGSLERSTLTRRVAYAIERKRQSGELAFLAQRDPLTRLVNRTTFEEKLSKAVSRCRRRAAECAVMFLDLDGFKAINDTHGHASGDTVLRETSRRLKLSVREEDTVARLGGDEFAILVEDITGDEGCSALCARLIEIVHAPIVLNAQLSVDVRASVGVALFPHAGRAAESLMQAADSAMYEAKAGGGGSVRLAKSRVRRKTDPGHMQSGS